MTICVTITYTKVVKVKATTTCSVSNAIAGSTMPTTKTLGEGEHTTACWFEKKKESIVPLVCRLPFSRG